VNDAALLFGKGRIFRIQEYAALYGYEVNIGKVCLN